MKCNRGPRPHSRALCLHGVYIYPGHSAPLPPPHPHTHTLTHPEKNCLIKLPQHVPRQNYSLNTTAGISSTGAQEHVAVALQSHWIVGELYQRSTLAGLIALLSLPVLQIPFFFSFLSSPHLTQSP